MPNILIKVPKNVFPLESRKELLRQVNEVADGAWGANGNLWHLGDFAKAAGYGHLQHRIGVVEK
jgi:hypothetical protein